MTTCTITVALASGHAITREAFGPGDDLSAECLSSIVRGMADEDDMAGEIIVTDWPRDPRGAPAAY